MTIANVLKFVLVVGAAATSSVGLAQWQPHEIRQLNGAAAQIRLPAQTQIVTESWHRVVAVPYIVNMPEKNRLLMLVGCDEPHRSYVLTSDDGGETWTDPRPARVDAAGKPSIGLGTGLTWLGEGTVMFYGKSADPSLSGRFRWFSRDYGQTWGQPVPLAPIRDGLDWHVWDPALVDRDPATGAITQLAETGYNRFQPPEVEHSHYQAFIRFSRDAGQTWTEGIRVPQWKRADEINLMRAGNGDLLAACRIDIPERMVGETLDHYEGLGVAVSQDDGRTWSDIQMLYEYGRHHPSMVLMPDQTVVMTYVVRLGYIKDEAGFPQFGIEAVVSHDHGRTWDLDHKYILDVWSGKRLEKNYWWPSSQATSSTLLADGSILTAFGTGYRIQAGPDSPQAPRDVGLVKWRLNSQPVNDERTIRDAPFDSELRNVFDPSASATASAAQPTSFTAIDHVRRTIYHSPQTPGYTCWSGCWVMPDSSIMVSCTQATGPIEGREPGPPEVLKKLSWPPHGRPLYDMTGLDMSNVHLRSTDGGETWTKVSADPYKSCMNFSAGQAEVALPDGTVMRAAWGHYLPYDPDVPKAGFLQRSKDGTKTWGEPELYLDPQRFSSWPKRLRLLQDGRLVLLGGFAEVPANSRERHEYNKLLSPMLMVSADGGRTWSDPIEVVGEQHSANWGGEEFDAAELPNGDLLCVFRRLNPEGSGEVRWQCLLRKQGDSWVPTRVGPASLPHSGMPELLATREGAILHVATNGIHYTVDAGATWNRLDAPGSNYYPRSIQVADGRIHVFGHLGGDNAYGSVDQHISMDTFRLRAVRD